MNDTTVVRTDGAALAAMVVDDNATSVRLWSKSHGYCNFGNVDKHSMFYEKMNVIAEIMAKDREDGQNRFETFINLMIDINNKITKI
jgi:hypothetical protein